MPLVVIWPFALFLVAGADVMDGRLRSMPFLVIGAALCVSGSVNMVPFIGAGVVMVAVRLVRQRATLGWRDARRPLAVSAAIGAAFAIPLLADLAHGSASNVAAIWRYARSSTTYSHPWRASLGYAARFWFQGAPGSSKPLVVALLLGALAAILVVAARRRAGPSDRPPVLDVSLLRPLLALVALETIVGLVYAHRYVDDLHLTYIEVFQLACPIVVFGAAGIALLDCVARVLSDRAPTSDGRSAHAPEKRFAPAPDGRFALIAVACAVLAVLVVAGHDSTPKGLRTTGVDTAAAAVRDRFGEQTVAIDFQLGEWEQGVALFIYEHRRGHPVCFANPDFLAMQVMPVGDQCGPLDASNARVQLVRVAASTAAADGELGEISGHNGTVSVRAMPVGS
jgi:hypothetical protein